MAEGYGESAALYYAKISNDPCSSNSTKAGAWVGGVFASLWTPETSNETFLTIVTSGVIGAWHVAKDGWHLGKLGYHSIGKGVLKSNLGKSFSQFANSKKFLHLNIASRHFIVKPGKILQQIKFWRYLK